MPRHLRKIEVDGREKAPVFPDKPITSKIHFRRNAQLYKSAILFHIAVDRGLVAKDSVSTRTMARRSHLRVLRETGFIGIGYGAKETAGKFTGELAVRLYVRRKLPLSALPIPHRIPSSIDGIFTDVVAMGKPRFHTRPTHLGSGISNIHGKAGSLGCLLRRPDDDGWFILSACHVLAPPGAAQIGDLIVEPPASTAGSARLAVLTDFEPLGIDDHVNRFDAAIARLDRPSDVTDTIPTIGEPQWPAMEPLLYQSVRKHGQTSLHTLGVVTDTLADVFIVDGGEAYPFAEVVLVSGAGGSFSTGGDSGALVVDAMTRRPVGLIIGGTSAGTFVSPLKPILRRFAVEAPSA